jgi:hypothetical protein
MMQTREK